MPDDSVTSACFICQKHRAGDTAEGGVLYEDDLVYVGHVHALAGPTAYRGHLVVEPKRHAPALGDLTDEEAAAVGRLCNRVARVLRNTAGAEHVYAFSIGDAVPHVHVQLMPRYPDSPRQYWGPRLSSWPDAPRVDSVAMRQLVSHLRQQLDVV